MSGEHEFPVAPLALPDPDDRHELEALGAYPGVELFLERARAARPDFRLSEANAGAVEAICARVDGLPLAIELAAARVRLLSPDGVRRRSLRVRSSCSRAGRVTRLTANARWVTRFRGVLPCSTEARGRCLPRLGVFAGGFTVDAAQAVAGNPGEAGVIDALGALIDHGLIQRPANRCPASRPRLLETIREFALEELATSGEQDDVRAAHAVFYVALARRHDCWFLEPEQANLRAALRWYLAREDQDGALALSAALSAFWLSQGPFE